GSSSPRRIPYITVGKLFLALTKPVARHQERVADALAAEAVGAGPLIECLQLAATIGPAFQAFLDQEFLPAVSAGFLPPCGEGFRRFLESVKVAETRARI